MKTPPTIAVVIPAHNRAATLGRCLESVVAQTVRPSEVIVVDDGSEDNTSGIAREYASIGVRCIQIAENGGAQAARNRGISEATAEWIAFLDSDDEWLPTKLERQVDALEAVGFGPWTVVHTGALWMRTQKNGLEPTTLLPAVDGQDVYAALLSEPGPMFPALIVSRVALERIDRLDEAVPSFQEWDTSIRLARYCRFISIAEPLFIYHTHEGETISQHHKLDIEGYAYVMRKFESDIVRVCGMQAWDRHVIRQLVCCLNWRLWNTADEYFPQVARRDWKYRTLQISRRLHLPPSLVSRAWARVPL